MIRYRYYKRLVYIKTELGGKVLCEIEDYEMARG
jgi:hypothetical protein